MKIRTNPIQARIASEWIPGALIDPLACASGLYVTSFPSRVILAILLHILFYPTVQTAAGILGPSGSRPAADRSAVAACSGVMSRPAGPCVLVPVRGQTQESHDRFPVETGRGGWRPGPLSRRPAPAAAFEDRLRALRVTARALDLARVGSRPERAETGQPGVTTSGHSDGPGGVPADPFPPLRQIPGRPVGGREHFRSVRGRRCFRAEASRPGRSTGGRPAALIRMGSGDVGWP